MRNTGLHSPDSLKLAGIAACLVVLTCELLSTGCCLTRRRAFWRAPVVAQPRRQATPSSLGSGHRSSRCACNSPLWKSGGSCDAAASSSALEAAELTYTQACALEEQALPDCVDFFLQACSHSWQYLEGSITPGQDRGKHSRAWQLYHSSLAKLIAAGQKHGRLDLSGGLSVRTSSGQQEIPIAYHGFSWHPKDFSSLVLVGDYDSPGLSHANRRRGLGVPTVVVRERACDERFHEKRHNFAATVILRPSHQRGANCRTVSTRNEPCGESSDRSALTLEFHDPLRMRAAEIGGRQVHLTTDTTAPLAFLLNTRKRNYIQEFIQPGRSGGESKLIMVEPYQPGKIPLVFVHGLLSDPLTWIDLVNEIRSRADLVDRYQIWAFKYPTGDEFLLSAASLRAELEAVSETFDPNHRDPALSRMVLVGHSMGGLIAKLQVTYSGTNIWNSVAKRPLDRINTSDQGREQLRRLFFFEPVPAVKRVVFIGTPHGGSALANRFVGRLGASLVRENRKRVVDHQQLIRDNPDTFSRSVAKRIPRSIDLLEPDDPILVSMQGLCVRPDVQLHSIVGTGRPSLMEGPGDGVVSVASARHAGVATERFVPTDHVRIHQHPDAVEEIIRILTRHYDEFDRALARGEGRVGGQARLSSTVR